MKSRNPQLKPSIRLFKLYFGVLAFAILAAWGTSVGLGHHLASATPSAVFISSPRIATVSTEQRLLETTSPSARTTTTVPATFTAPIRTTTAQTMTTTPRTSTASSSSGDGGSSVTTVSNGTNFVSVDQNVDVITLPPGDSSSTITNSSDTTTTTTTSPE